MQIGPMPDFIQQFRRRCHDDAHDVAERWMTISGGDSLRHEGDLIEIQQNLARASADVMQSSNEENDLSARRIGFVTELVVQVTRFQNPPRAWRKMLQQDGGPASASCRRATT